jgi:hypothetical protein
VAVQLSKFRLDPGDLARAQAVATVRQSEMRC